MDFSIFLVAGLSIESLINTVTWAIEKGFVWQRVTAIALGILIAVLSGLDFFLTAGLPLSVPFVGSVLTGLILARGSNVAADLFKLIQGLKTTYN